MNNITGLNSYSRRMDKIEQSHVPDVHTLWRASTNDLDEAEIIKAYCAKNPGASATLDKFLIIGWQQ